jgi:DNA polymerase-3 subunit delta'
MARDQSEAIFEADRCGEVRHPRETFAFYGHAEAEAELLEAYRSDRLPQAILIGGPVGIGKATFAWRIARFILSHPDSNEAVVRNAADLSVGADHPAVRRITSLTHGDLFLLRREWNEKAEKPFTEIRADDVRRAIHMFQRAAGSGGCRICIVDSAEDLNRSGANALLKLIEEPPPRSLFLIVAHRPLQVIPTIRSRCRKILLKPLAPAEIQRATTALGPPWTEVGAEDLLKAAERAKGSVPNALRLLGGQGLELDTQIRRLLDELPRLDWRDVHALADHVTGRDHISEYDVMMTSIFDWLDATVRAEAERGARRLVPFAEAWEKIAEAARETEALNLDKRPLILSIFAELTAAARA